jgi:uncharacterized protein involved in exopolysaccharide biosynthesis
MYAAAMVLIDTIALVSRLEAAGMSRQQAEAIATALAHADETNLATKTDVTALKADLDAAKAELRQEIAELRSELRTEISALRAEVKSDLVRVVVVNLAALGIATTAIIALA